MRRLFLFIPLGLAAVVYAKAPAAPVEDLPVPYDIQAVPLTPNVALSWNWRPLPDMPGTRSVTYELQRGTVTISNGKEPRYIDKHLAPGTWTYRVRTRAQFLGEPKTTQHVSEWSESVNASITAVCEAFPELEWEASATPPVPSASKGPPEVRVRLVGRIKLAPGCTLQQAEAFFVAPYGNGTERSEVIHVDSQGTFDQTFVALDAAESGDAESVDVFMTASSEAGRIKSDSIHVDLLKRNKFAPSNSKF